MVSDHGGAAPLTGGVSLSEALSALRDELMQAVWAGQFPYQFDGGQRTLRFKPAPIEVTLEVAVTATGEGHAGVKWWLIDAGGALSREKVTTQIVKLTLEPLLFDETGHPIEVLVDAPDGGDGHAGSEDLLDGAD